MCARTILLSIVAAIAIGGCAPQALEANEPMTAENCPCGPGEGGEAKAPALTVVEDTSLVCMIKDHYMGQPQIAVPVGDRTYYGCCEGCKARLQTEAAARSAVDPVSGETVDKALAVIGREKNNKVHYFKSMANL